MKYKIKVVNVRTDKLPRHKYYRIYCGRGTILGNPYAFKHSARDVIYVNSRKKAISRYETYLLKKLKNKDNEIFKGYKYLMKLFLRHKKIELACYCAPKKCHCDILKKLLFKELALDQAHEAALKENSKRQK